MKPELKYATLGFIANMCLINVITGVLNWGRAPFYWRLAIVGVLGFFMCLALFWWLRGPKPRVDPSSD